MSLVLSEAENAAGTALHLAVLADVAQLVEHFTRNEGVRGSSPRVGFALAVAFSSVETQPRNVADQLMYRVEHGRDAGMRKSSIR